MIGRFRLELVNQMTARKLSNEWLRSAKIRVRFGDGKNDSQLADFECLVAVVDDLGRLRKTQGSGVCWPHDPAKEFKSARS